MQYDGNLVIYALDGTAVWSTGTAGNSGATFRIQKDRNLVLADSDNGLLWTSNSYTNARKLSKVGDNIATSVHHERTRRLSSREDRHLKTTIQDDQDRRLYDANSKIVSYNHDADTGPYYGVSFVKVWSINPRVTAITGCCTAPNECQGNQTNDDLNQSGCSNPEPDACLTEAPSEAPSFSFVPTFSPTSQPTFSPTSPPTSPPTINRKFQSYDV